MSKEELENLNKEYKIRTTRLFTMFKTELDNLTEEFIYKLGQIKDR